MNFSSNIAVVGIGNILVSDEGVGIQTVEELEKRYRFTPQIKLVNGGTLGFTLINEVEEYGRLIIVDAVKAGGEPGTIYKFKPDDIALKFPLNISAHDIGFIEILEQWKMSGFNPEVVFLGIEPKEISLWSMELSDCIKNKLPKLISLVLKELDKLGIKAAEKNS